MIELENISVIYHKNGPLEHTVLDNLNFNLEQGKIAAITGNNGAGKSTLAKLLTGEIYPDTGKIILDRRDCTKMSTCQRSSYVARVFQNPLLGTASELTVLENMAFASKRGKKRSIFPAITKNCEAFFTYKLKEIQMGLEDKIHYPVSALSGGQRQALSLLMASLAPAKLMILDEHTAALSPESAEKIMELTYKILKSNNITAIMITHKKHETWLCDISYKLSQGKLHLEESYSKN